MPRPHPPDEPPPVAPSKRAEGARRFVSSVKTLPFAAALALLLVLGAGWLARSGERPAPPDTAAGEASQSVFQAQLESAAPAVRSSQRTATTSPEADPPEMAAPPAPVPPSPPQAALRIHVHSASDRAAVGGARVVVLAAPPGSIIAAVAGDTDEYGVFEAQVPAERVLDVHVNAGQDWHGASVQIDVLAPGERLRVDVPVTPVTDRTFVGRVVRREDGSPIDGARALPKVSRNWGPTPAEVLPPSTTDAGGFFTIRQRSNDRGILRVEAPGRSPTFVEVTEGHSTRESAREIPLDRSCELSLRVVDERANATGSLFARLDLSDAELLGSRWAPFSRAALRADVEQNGVESDGVFSFADVPAGLPLEVTLRPGDWKILYRRLVVLEGGERRELVARIPRGCRVVGGMLDQHGQPVRRKGVRLAQLGDPRPCQAWAGEYPAHTTATDELGRFAFEDVAPGSWLIGVTDSYALIASRVRAIEIPEGTTELRIELDVDRALSLEGLVLDARGEPAGSRRVRAQGGEGECGFDVATDRDGSFRIVPVPMDVYTLTACDLQGRSCSDEVSAVPGEAIVLRLSDGGGLLVSAHDAATGEPRSGAVYVARSGRTLSAQALEGSSPQVILDGLRPGHYEVVVQAENGDIGLAAGVVVQVDHRLPVDVPLRPSARLEVRSQRERPILVRVLHSGVQFAEGTCSSDHAALAVVPPGEVVVRAFEPPTTMLLERVVHVEPGSVTTLDLEE